MATPGCVQRCWNQTSDGTVLRVLSGKLNRNLTLKQNRSPKFPRCVNDRAVLAREYLYLLQLLFFTFPFTGKPAGHRISGSRWKAGDFLLEHLIGSTLGSTARLFLSFGSREFRFGQVPSSSFLSCDCLCVPGERRRVTPGYLNPVGSMSGPLPPSSKTCFCNI